MIIKYGKEIKQKTEYLLYRRQRSRDDHAGPVLGV